MQTHLIRVNIRVSVRARVRVGIRVRVGSICIRARVRVKAYHSPCPTCTRRTTCTSVTSAQSARVHVNSALWAAVAPCSKTQLEADLPIG